MIDIHSHIVFEVDDGAKTIDQSIEMIKEAKDAGFEKIIVTPHYMENYYEKNRNEIESKVSEIKDKLMDINCRIPIYIGNEIYITENIIKLLENQKASSINDKQYVLFELPLNAEAMNLNRVVYLLLENGKIPILAHPERYPFVQKDVNSLIQLIESGVLMQSNYGSIIGQYGKNAENTVKEMLKHNMVHMLGSDAHRDQTIYLQIEKCMKKIEKIVGEEELENITNLNIQKVLDGEKIEVKNPQYVKENFFSKIFK